MRHDVKILYDVRADTIGYIQVYMGVVVHARSMTAPALRARRDYNSLRSESITFFEIRCFLFF